MKTKKVLIGVSTTAVSLVLAGCGSGGTTETHYSSTTIPAKPTDQHCSDWDWDADDYAWECDDSRSSYYGHYFYGGNYYSSISSLKSSKAGASYTEQVNLSKSSSGNGASSSGSRTSSGFGSGSSSSGG